MIDRVRHRDPEALNAFFERYFDRAYGYVCRLVKDPHEAEDITQVAFVKIHRAVHNLDPSRDPTSWVFAVVANTVRDYWRSKRYKQSRADTPLKNTVVATRATAEDDQAARDAARLLEGAMAQLSEKLRAVVLLRDYEDLSYAEVARALKTTEATARKRHSRALREMRRTLSTESASAGDEGRER